MNIVACIKQVPATQQVKVDPETGNLMRAGVRSKMNPFDLFALEVALRLRAAYGGQVTVITMGPPQAEAVLREAYTMGADHGVLLTDRRFAGADVLATSRTLAAGIAALPGFDLILCGRQTTDGDTAQVGPALAETLGIPHVTWIREITGISDGKVMLVHELPTHVMTLRLPLPALLTVEKDTVTPRLPSYRTLKAVRDKPIQRLTCDDLVAAGADAKTFGSDGSPTRVERVYTPTHEVPRVRLTGTAAETARQLAALLREQRIL